MQLITTANIPDQDAFYETLIESQRDMNDEEAAMMNCKLVILLANHIGDPAVLREAIEIARGRG